MPTLLETKIISGKQIIGYKIFKSTTTRYAGGSAGITSFKKLPSATSGNRVIYFNFDGKAFTGGYYDKAIIGIHAASGISVESIATLRIYRESIENNTTVYNNVANADIPLYFLSTPGNESKVISYNLIPNLSLLAGDIIALDLPYNADGTFYIYATYDYPPYYIYTAGSNEYQSIDLNSITNNNYINENNIYSFELVGGLSTPTEITSCYGGLTLLSTHTATSQTTNIDLGSTKQLSALSFSSSTFYDYNIEILISKQDTALPSDSSWISVYSGKPSIYGNISSLGAGYIGFPFSCRHIKIITSYSGSINATINTYISETQYISYLPKSVISGSDFILADVTNNDTSPSWYMIVPVLDSLAYGVISAPISNRINL